MIPGLLSAVICFAVFMVTHIALFHLARVPNRLKAMGLVWLVLIALYAGLYLLFQRHLPANLRSPVPMRSVEGVVDFLSGLLVYLLLFLSYCCFYFTDHSLSLAFMLEMESRPQKQMTFDELKRHFSYDKMLERRLGDMVANGFLTREGEYYRIAPKGKRNAGFMSGMKIFLNLGPGG